MTTSDRLGIRMTDEQKQRIHENMQETIEDILTDHGMRPITKTSGAPLVVVATSADVVPAAGACHGALVPGRSVTSRLSPTGKQRVPRSSSLALQTTRGSRPRSARLISRPCRGMFARSRMCRTVSKLRCPN